MKRAFLVAMIAMTLFAAVSSSPPSGGPPLAVKKEIKATQVACLCPVADFAIYPAMGGEAMLPMGRIEHKGIYAFAGNKPSTPGDFGRTIRMRVTGPDCVSAFNLHIDPGLI